MSRAMNRVVLAAAVLCVTAVAALAQQTTASTETKTFEILAVDGNTLVARLPEGTRELTVADDFRFVINGQPMSVRELKPGMRGTATITTRTTVTPVTVTEVKNGTVAVRSGSTIIVRTDEGVRSFSQGEVDKRGVKIVRDGKPVQLSQLREGDRLSAIIITSQPPESRDRAGGERHPRCGQDQRWRRGATVGGGRRPPVGIFRRSVASGRQPASGAGVNAVLGGQDAAGDGQFVAAPRAREPVAARDGVCLDDDAVLRPVGGL